MLSCCVIVAFLASRRAACAPVGIGAVHSSSTVQSLHSLNDIGVAAEVAYLPRNEKRFPMASRRLAGENLHQCLGGVIVGAVRSREWFGHPVGQLPFRRPAADWFQGPLSGGAGSSDGEDWRKGGGVGVVQDRMAGCLPAAGVSL